MVSNGEAPAGWYADPHGKAEKRYWDGSGWTNRLFDGEATFVEGPPPAASKATVKLTPISADEAAQAQLGGEAPRRVATFAADAGAFASVARTVRRLLRTSWRWVRASRRNAAIAAVGGAAGVLIVAGVAGAPQRDVEDEAASQGAARVVVAETGAVVAPTEPSTTTSVFVLGTIRPPPTATTTSSTVTAAGPDAALAGAIGVQLLEQFELGALDDSTAYVRFDYQGDGWSDFDGDCRSTRHEVLLAESLVPAVLSDNGCFVESGLWIDPWTGEELTDASEATIDHLVPLAHAHQVGAWLWDADTKSRFTNDDDPAALAVVSQSSNSSKGASSPADWRPQNEAVWCGYALDWIRVKDRWDLWITSAEHDALGEMLATCSNPTTDGPVVHPLLPLSLPTVGTTVPPTTAPPATLPPPSSPPVTAAPAPPAQNCHPSYPTVCIPGGPDLDCGEITFRRFTVVGSDPHGFDGDNDGVGCES